MYGLVYLGMTSHPSAFLDWGPAALVILDTLNAYYNMVY